MVGCFKKGNKKSMSDSNIEVLQKPQKNDRCKECCTFSGQYNAPLTSDVPNVINKVLPSTSINPRTYLNNPQPCACPPCACPPCACPPYPYPPQDDLWDLQFCRWWGWNWIRKRDELVNKQKKTQCTKREKSVSPRRYATKRKKVKQDDFFSWCNKMFKGRQRECPLKTEEKQKLQDMYDTPSVITVNKCCESPLPSWECKPVDLHQRNMCYSNSGRQTSMSTFCMKNKSRREVNKCNKRKHQPWLCEIGESSSSEEWCPHVNCQYSNSPMSSTEESVEYLALRMESLNTDHEENCNRYQKQLKCCQKICPTQMKHTTKNACPCKFKVACERKGDNERCRKVSKKCRTISDPYNGKFSEWNCNCGRHCACLQKAPLRYPQFSRFARDKNTPKQEQIQTQKRKEYIIHCPFIQCKKLKNRCKCCCNSQCTDCEWRYKTSKVMADKSVSCPGINLNQNYNVVPRNNQHEPILQGYKKNALNAFQDSMASAFKNGQFSSPISGKVYELNPQVIRETSLPHHNNFPNPLGVNEPLLNFQNSEIPFVDKEHNTILTAVCEAIMSSHLSDQGSDKMLDDEGTMCDLDYLFMDKYPLKNSNYNFMNDIGTCAQKPAECTDKCVGYHDKNGKLYETVPVQKAYNQGSRIPLLKKKPKPNSKNQTKLDGNFETANIIKTTGFSPDNFINNKCEFDLNSYKKGNGNEQSSKYINGADNLETNAVSFKSPWSLTRSSKLPGICINGLMSAISNTFINKNYSDKRDKRNVPDSITFQSSLYSCQPNSLQQTVSCNVHNEADHLFEDNYNNSYTFWNENVPLPEVQRACSNSCKCQSINNLDFYSTLENLPSNIDLNLHMTSNDGFRSNLDFNKTYDLSYLENAQNSIVPADIGSEHNQFPKEESFSQDQKRNDWQLESNNSFTNNTYGLDMFGPSSCKDTSENITKNTGTKKPRIPIQDIGLREHDKLLTIIEERNIQPTHTGANSKFPTPSCSKQN